MALGLFALVFPPALLLVFAVVEAVKDAAGATWSLIRKAVER